MAPQEHLKSGLAVTGLRTTTSKTPRSIAAELNAALDRESALIRERDKLALQQVRLAQEFEHRLINGLQLISSLLSLQSRSAGPEAAAQLTIAAKRVSALGRVHHRLHLLDNQDYVKLKAYLQSLCADLSDLLFANSGGPTISVTGAEIELPTSTAIPFGFIVNELITNSVKYAQGRVNVEIKSAAGRHSLSVTDDGPGLPDGFDPAAGKGLGMKIVRGLVSQIGGRLDFAPGSGGHGACFTVVFGTMPANKSGA